MADSNNTNALGARPRTRRSYGELKALARQWSDRSIASFNHVFSISTPGSDRVEGQAPEEEQGPGRPGAEPSHEPLGQAPEELAVPQAGGRTQPQHILDHITPQGIGTPVVSPEVDTHPPTPPLLQTANHIRPQPSRKAMGQGLFAAMPLKEGEVIYNEAPTLRCDYHKYAWHQRECDVVEQWVKLDRSQRSNLRFYFAQLTDIPDKDLSSRQRRLLKKFVRRYAFRTDMAAFQIGAAGNSSKQALIYMKPCLMNHACINHSNCKFSVQNVRPYSITIELKKDVTADEELLVNYREGNPFSCADCCSPLHNKLRRIGFNIRRGFDDLASKLREIRVGFQDKRKK